MKNILHKKVTYSGANINQTLVGNFIFLIDPPVSADVAAAKIRVAAKPDGEGPSCRVHPLRPEAGERADDA